MTNLNRTLQNQIKDLKIKNTESVQVENVENNNNNSQEQS